MKGSDMRAEDMTPSQLRALADAKEKETDFEHPVKMGTLKCDLYQTANEEIMWDYNRYFTHGGFITKENMDRLLDGIFGLAIPKGTKFKAFKYEGDLLWDADKGDLEEADQEWADEFLEDIRDIT